MYTFLNAHRLARLEIYDRILDGLIKDENLSRLSYRCLFYCYFHECKQFSNQLNNLILING